MYVLRLSYIWSFVNPPQNPTFTYGIKEAYSREVYVFDSSMKFLADVQSSHSHSDTVTGYYAEDRFKIFGGKLYCA